MNPDAVILACIAVPVVGALLVALTGCWPNVRESVTLLSAATLFALVLSLFHGVAAGARPEALVAEMMPGLSIAFAVEPLGMLFALVASLLWIVTSVYSIGYMRGHHETNQTRFYACFALALASTMGVAFAGNLLTLFIFYEALTLFDLPAGPSTPAPTRRDGPDASISGSCSAPPSRSSSSPSSGPDN